jgi:hypothetical protein
MVGIDADREKGNGDGGLVLLESTSSICILMDIPRENLDDDEEEEVPP